MAVTQESQPGKGVWRLGPGKAPEPSGPKHSPAPLGPNHSPAQDTEDPEVAPVTAETSQPWAHIEQDTGRTAPTVVVPTAHWLPDVPSGVASNSPPAIVPTTGPLATSPCPSPDSLPSVTRGGGRAWVPASVATMRDRLPPRWVLGAIGAVVIFAAAVATAAAQQGPTPVTPPVVAESAGAVSTPAVVEPTQEPSVSTTDEPTPSTDVADTEQTATGDLETLHQQDLATFTFTGQWVAQLSSKIPGILDPLQTAHNGMHTFGATDILWEHQELRGADNLGADVRLLLSTDYGQRELYQGQPLWVTVAVDPAFGTSAEVEAWCARRFASLSGGALTDQCAPRQLNPPA
jgi:hypothetical protein